MLYVTCVWYIFVYNMSCEESVLLVLMYTCMSSVSIVCVYVYGVFAVYVYT